MKTPLPPSLQSALAEVAAIADRLAMTFDEDGMTASYGPVDMNVHGVLDNLDFVAACLTLDELENAPAMLNAAARAFRQTFNGFSEGFAAAGRLQSIAYMIELEQTAAAAARPWNGIDENTRDPLELDDNAPDVPSELDEIEPQL